MNNAITRLLALAVILGGLFGSSIAGPIPKPEQTASTLGSTTVVGEPLHIPAVVPSESTTTYTAAATTPVDDHAGDRGNNKDETLEGEVIMNANGRGGYN
ncbi:hypothetical protein PG996_012528 [Apiospora saccharicola]|uniref:Uncharacterized protein n=1 Tax=Apiospora saccharicola TaxID=335842 RepID=A0ABR1U3E8_9PEZI